MPDRLQFFLGKTRADYSLLPGRSWPAALLILAALAPLWAAAPRELGEAESISAGRRIVAVGDIHGDLDSFVAILKRAKLIDGRRRWIGDDAILVQTGDFLDRGTQELEVMELLRSLQKQASRRGGRVEVLLGNHEVLNLLRDFRYVSPQAWEGFSTPKSERRRRRALEDYQQFLLEQAKRRGQPPPVFDDSFRQRWLDQHPPGYFERLDKLEGRDGKWLKSLPTVVKIDDSVFLHGGLHPRLATAGLEKLNQQVNKEIEALHRYIDFLVQQQVVLPFFSWAEMVAAVSAELAWVREQTESDGSAPPEKYAELLQGFLNSGNWLLLHPDGPLWFRGYVEWEPEEGEAHLQTLLEAYQATRIVVGHNTVLQKGIQSRFGNKVYLIDTGMLSSYYPGGQASALEIKKGKVKPIYLTPAP